MKLPVLAVLIFGAGCAVKQPAPSSYRLADIEKGPVLVPPRLLDAAARQAQFVAAVPVKSCGVSESGAVSVKARGRITVWREELVKEPDGWLGHWAADLESRGCVAAGDGLALAKQVAESVPLDLRTEFRLLFGEGIDIQPPLTIQVDSPIFRKGSSTVVFANEPIKVTDMPGGVQVELQSGGDFIGYERSWYRIVSKAGTPGSRIEAMKAERHVDGNTEPLPKPANNYFAVYPAAASYYRLIYKQQQTEFTALIVAGRTWEELNANALKLDNAGANCTMVGKDLCVAIPKGSAANLFIPVMVNGKEELVHWGGTVADALGGRRMRNTVPEGLSILKPHNGKPVPVEWEKSGASILELRLVGGETITFGTK